MKYIIVTGGVISGLGKGITISSIGRIVKSSGLRVTAIKIDPYLNVDAGLMSPFEHGETFVLDDGGETDLDLGNYERFLDITLSGKHNITSGKVYQEVCIDTIMQILSFHFTNNNFKLRLFQKKDEGSNFNYLFCLLCTNL